MSFELSEDQNNKASEWIKTHVDPNGKICNDKYHGAIGGCFTFSFTPTSIGTIIRIECASCKGKIDLSDYEDW